MTPSSSCSLAGRVALVTGGSGGIGRAVAGLLSSRGASTVITALPSHVEDAQKVAAELDDAGGPARAYELDVRSCESIDAIIERIRIDFGHLDILVNNAGVRLVASSLTVGEQEWDEVTSVNLRGTFFCAQGAARLMQSAGGSIVTIASQLGLVAARDRAAYCATKAAIIHLTRALALDWAVYGIRVNAVAPGPTNTPSLNVANTPQEAIDFLARMPIGRPIEPAEVAEAVAFLAGPQSEAITGQTLAIDGGWTLP
jgi:2-dehydro-3-deoxy-D-gluconate 5-dehydrogenase